MMPNNREACSLLEGEAEAGAYTRSLFSST